MILQNRQSLMAFSRRLKPPCYVRFVARGLSAPALNDNRSRNPLKVVAQAIESQRRPLRDQCFDRRRLTETEFHHQPSARFQPTVGGVEHPFDGYQSFFAA